MIEIEEPLSRTPPLSRQQPGWLLSTFIRPARTMREIAQEERSVWLLPVLILTALVLISTLVAGPLRMAASQNMVAEPPPSFEWMSPEQQEQFLQAQQGMNSPVTTTVFPAIGAVVGVWMGWFLLASILHLVMTMLGSRSTSTTAYNLTAWASLPFAIRLIVQIIAMLTAKQVITSPGLSGFVAADAAGVMLYVKSLLRLVDIYWIWQFFLLWLGAAVIPGLTRRKAFSAVAVSILLVLLLSGLPGFIIGQFSGMDVNRPFMFF